MDEQYQHLSAEERGTIMALQHQGQSVRAIALVLGRAASTISRELRRNGWRNPAAGPAMGRPPLSYDATRAGQRARRMRVQLTN